MKQREYVIEVKEVIEVTTEIKVRNYSPAKAKREAIQLYRLRMFLETNAKQTYRTSKITAKQSPIAPR